MAGALAAIRNAFRSAPPEVSEQQDFLRAAADMGDARVERYGLYDDYYCGEHRAQVLDRAREYLEASGLRFSENFCETVVDTHAAQLRITGWTVGDDESASTWLTENWWLRPETPAIQGTVHNRTLTLGDGFLIAEFDMQLGMPRLCWNDPSCVKPVYDPDDADKLLYVPKVWVTNRRSPTNPSGMKIRRLNIYYPDRIEKWFAVGNEESENAEWLPHLDAEDDGQWPIPWTRSGTISTVDGEVDPDDALGIPGVHFRHRALGKQWGRSLLHGVIPQQDALTKQVLDLFYVMDTQGWKQRWATGLPEASKLIVAAGEWVRSTANETKFGEFAAEDPRPLVETIEGTLRRMSARSKTPLHDLIKGTPPSGEALKTSRSGLVEITKVRQTEDFGTSWGQAARLSALLAEVFGNGPTIEVDAPIEPVWDDPETRDEKAETETYGIRVEKLGLSKTTALRELGYDPDEERELRDQEAEEAAANAKALAEAGNVPPFAPVLNPNQPKGNGGGTAA